MPSPPDRAQRPLRVAFVCAAILAVAFAGMRAPWISLHYVAKPLAMVCLLLLANSTTEPVGGTYRTRIVLGLTASLVGDVLLMLPGDYFVPGLCAFLLAHVCYIAAFFSQTGRVVRLDVMTGYLLVAGSLLLAIYPSLPADLRLPVLAYVGVITLMATQSGTWMLVVQTPSQRRAAIRAAIGASWFLVSDATLAIDRFRAPVPFRDLVILGTYFLAQWLIARSVEATAPEGT